MAPDACQFIILSMDRSPKQLWIERGQRIQEAMDRIPGMSQPALAEKVGTSQTTISSIVRGLSSGENHVSSIAEALNVSTEWIMTGLPRAPWEGSEDDEKALEKLALEQHRRFIALLDELQEERRENRRLRDELSEAERHLAVAEERLAVAEERAKNRGKARLH